ncbi:MAG: hypothetical protein AAFZ15_27055 [Bacteroidota bacterium]
MNLRKVGLQIIAGILLLALLSCNHPPQPTSENADPPSFRVFENKRIDPDIYWHFNLEEGERDVYEINTGKEKILMESAGNNFELNESSFRSANSIIISNDGNAYLPVRGNIRISGKKNKLKAEIDLSAVFINDLNQVDTAAIKKSTSFDYTIKFSGNVAEKKE